VFSSQQVHIEVGAVNRNVASSALTAGLKSKPSVRRLGQLVESGMTLQAELAAFATDQQHAIS
jgi:hypothetical protein